jgi:cytochrome c2
MSPPVSLLFGVGLGAVLLGTGQAAPAAAPGDAGRGLALFQSKECARCHLSRGRTGVGPALEDLRQPQGAWELAGRLWNHAPAMFAAFGSQGLGWPEISAAEMADLMAYLDADPARDPAPDRLQGEAELVRKGCLKCHSLRGEGGRVGPDLGGLRAAYESAPVWAARMWVHTPRMAAEARRLGILYPRFSGREMDDLIGFLKSVAK